MGMLEIEEPGLLHGKVGAVLLNERFGIDDSEIFCAISDHVTGRVGMGILSKIYNKLKDAHTRNTLKSGGMSHTESQAALDEMKAKEQRAKGQK